MRTAANLERVSYEFAEDNYNEGVRYFEVRFAPQLVASLRSHSSEGKEHLNVQEVIMAVNAGLKRACVEANERRAAREAETFEPEPMYEYGIICCAMRSFPPCEYYDAFLEIHGDLSYERVCSLASETLVQCAIKCRDELSVPIVALDVAGAEEGFPNKVHKTAFDIAHENFLNKTVHAGEGFGPESIFQAIRDLHADRIGHGFHLFSVEKVTEGKSAEAKEEYVRKLIKHISDRRVNLEVCLTSNLGTMPGLQLKDHALKKMLEHGVSVTLNTDNRLVSDTTVSLELRKAVDTFDLTPKQLREIVVCGFKRSFFAGPYSAKRKYIRRVMDCYDAISEKHGVNDKFSDYMGSRGVDDRMQNWFPGSP